MATNLEKKVVPSVASPIKTSSSGQSKNRVLKRKTSKFGSVKVGDVCEFNISALGPNNIGIDEFSFPYPVFVPNAKYGSKVQAKMVKIVSPLLSGKGLLSSGSVDGNGLLGRLQAGLGNSKQKVEKKSYAVAQLMTPFGQSEVKQANVVDILEKTPVKAGDVLTVSIKKKGSFGIVELEKNYRLIVPLSVSLTSYENVEVMVTRIKKEYGFASLVLATSETSPNGLEATKNGRDSLIGRGEVSSLPSQASKLNLGSKLTLTLPLNPLAKIYGKYVVFKLENTILFVKLEKGVNLGSKVRIKITSTSSNLLGTLTSAVGRILKINPLSKQQKSALVMKSIREMVSHGMHFGEKAVKCHARMKNYIWLKTEKNGALPYPEGAAKLGKAVGSLQTESTHVLNGATEGTEGRGSLSVPTLWSGNPISSGSASKPVLQTKASLSKERPLIKKGRNILNLLKTRRCLNQALNKLTKYALKGRTFLFIGTKKPASGLVARASFFTKNSFYVNTRWLGGMLTNWKTICKSISKIRPILKEKQKVVRDILERRQMIKSRLIKKALLLRKKSKLILTKGRSLLEALKKASSLPSSAKQSRFSTSNYMTLRNDFVTRGMILLEKRQKFMQKRRELISQTLLLKENGLKMSLKHKAILSQLAIYAKKLREYKYLLILTSEIQNLTGGGFSVPSSFPSEKGSEASPLKNLVSVSYSKLKEVSSSPAHESAENQSWIIPNPPKEILNKMVLTMKNQQSPLPLGFNDSLISPNLLQTMAGKEATLHLKGAMPSAPSAVCSTLLSKFSHFSSYIKSVIKQLISYIQALEAQSHSYSTELNQIQMTLKSYLSFKQKYVAELQQFKKKIANERSVIRIVKRQLKALDAQKKFLKFLPRLRYLPTPQTKISEIVQILLSKIVDPKFKYPIENIYDQKLSNTSKKLAAARKKKWQRLEKYFGGIANMTKLTKSQISRNVAIIVGQKEEMNAVRECQKLGIKMFTIVDTNCNPTLSDHIIPANDDSRSSIKYILTKFITRIRLAQKLRSRFSLSLANRRLPAEAISN